MVQVMNEALKIIWPKQLFYDRVRLLITDQAHYMIKTGKIMKLSLFTEMLHVTSLVHACHRVAELVRSNDKTVNEFVSNMKKIFIKSDRRRHSFKNETGIVLPRFFIHTRWGTWINFCSFLIDHFDEVKKYIESLDGEEAETIIACKKSLQDSCPVGSPLN